MTFDPAPARAHGRPFGRRMRASLLIRAAAVAVLLLGTGASSASAQASDSAQALRAEITRLRQDLEALSRQYGDRLTALETKLAELSGTPQVAAAPPAPVTPDVPAWAAGGIGPTGAAPSAMGAKIFNPDMAVVGNALGAAGTNRVNPEPVLQLREAEISLQSAVDPYARADFFISVSAEGAALEEGFVTFPTLPLGMIMKVGKMKAAFGKVNTLHPHVLPWTDQPLAMNLVGGEEGFNSAGISVAGLVPNPWVFLEATGQVFRGDTPGVFQSSNGRDLSYVGHLRGYQDITESTNLDMGVSWARGRNPSSFVDDVEVGHFSTDLYGVDATFRWRPLQRAIYNSLLVRSEVFWSRRDQPSGLQDGRGFFVSGDYQLARRWFAGARVDRSVDPADVSLVDSGQSLLLTFRPSEFSLIRGQYRSTKYGSGDTANQFLFLFQFAIGAHGAHPF